MIARCFAAFAMAIIGVSASAADLKPWKHVVIEPKGDAGFMLMVGARDFASRHGLKLEIVPMKNGALAHKALLAGEVDSIEFEPGRRNSCGRTRRRHQDHRVRLAGCAAWTDGKINDHQGRRSQGKNDCGGSPRIAAEPPHQRHSRAAQDARVRCAFCQSRW